MDLTNRTLPVFPGVVLRVATEKLESVPNIPNIPRWWTAGGQGGLLGGLVGGLLVDW